MSSRRPLIAGNWKMNKTGPEAEEYARGLRATMPTPPEGVDVAVCPPFTALAVTAAALSGSGVAVLAQAVHEAAKGAHTGEISAGMILAAGATGALVGHSERRAAGEDDVLVAARLRAGLDASLDVILCVGESLEQREAGHTERWLAGQVDAALRGLDEIPVDRLAIAYEPIWAIGTGRTATPDIAQDACAHVRAIAGGFCDADRLRILYGGSVTPDNAEELLGEDDVDGALVGGASLDPDSFAAIVGAA
jgi:triosephosphate isomerase